MNTAKHTPGPWTVSAGRVITTRSGQFYLTYGKDKHGNPLFKDFVELDNNAHLIAAAPAMYEALQMVSTILYDIADSAEDVAEWNEGGQMYELSRVVKTALAQAEGSKP